MASSNGYKLLKKTNDDSDFSTSKPGPSSETQSEDENDGKVRVISGPAILEPSKVESLSFDEIFAKKWTRSCPQISTTGDPRSTSVSSNNRNNLESSSEESSQWSDSVGGDNQQQQLQPDGGEGGDNQQQQLQPDGGEGGDNQPQLQPDGGEGGDNQQQLQPDGGEGGDNQQQLQPDGGEGGDNQQDGEPRSSCWAAFKEFYLSGTQSLRDSWFIYLFQSLSITLVVANAVLGWTSIGHCVDTEDKPTKVFSDSMFGASFFVFILTIYWWCMTCRRKISCLSCCFHPCAPSVMFVLILLSFICIVAEFTYYFKTKCEGSFNVCGIVMQVFNLPLFIFGLAIYLPVSCSWVPNVPPFMDQQNGDCRHNVLDEAQV